MHAEITVRTGLSAKRAHLYRAHDKSTSVCQHIALQLSTNIQVDRAGWDRELVLKNYSYFASTAAGV